MIKCHAPAPLRYSSPPNVLDAEPKGRLRRLSAPASCWGITLPDSQRLFRMEVQVQGVKPVRAWVGTGWIPTHHA